MKMERAMRKAFILLIFVFFMHGVNVWAANFYLVGSFPENGGTISREVFYDRGIYVGFNNPIDRSTIGLIRIRDLSEPSVCQLNICGFFQFFDNDAQFIWVPNRQQFQRSTKLRIELGIVKEQEGQPTAQVKDIYGNELEVTTIDFEICDPVVNVELIGPGCRLCPGEINCFGDFSVIAGETIKGRITLTNPECSASKMAEGKFWIELPNGLRVSIIDPHITGELSPGQIIGGELFEYTFTGNEPLGSYTFGAALLNAITGESYSRGKVAFNFKQCL